MPSQLQLLTTCLVVNWCIACLSGMDCGYFYSDSIGWIVRLNDCVQSESSYSNPTNRYGIKFVCNSANDAILMQTFGGMQCLGDVKKSSIVSTLYDKFNCNSNTKCDIARLSYRNYSKTYRACTNNEYYSYGNQNYVLNDECFVVNNSYSIFQKCTDSAITKLTYNDGYCSNLISTTNFINGECEWNGYSYFKYAMNAANNCPISTHQPLKTSSVPSTPTIKSQKSDMFTSNEINKPLLYAAIIFTFMAFLVSVLLLIRKRAIIQNCPSRRTFKDT
eukprot:132692_1